MVSFYDDYFLKKAFYAARRQGLSDFAGIWCVGALLVHGGGLEMKTGTGSRNEPSTAAILNFVFDSLITYSIEPLSVTETLKHIVSGNSVAEIIEEVIAALPPTGSVRHGWLDSVPVQRPVTATGRLCLTTVAPTYHMPSEAAAIGDCAHRRLSICEVFNTAQDRTNTWVG